MMSQEDLDERVRSAMGRRVPGVALVVVGRDGARARSAVGRADLVSGTPIATDMVIPWFSMTKIATATTAAQARWSAGRSRSRRPVLPFVPGDAIAAAQEWAERITCGTCSSMQVASSIRSRSAGSIPRSSPAPTPTRSSKGC